MYMPNVSMATAPPQGPASSSATSTPAALTGNPSPPANATFQQLVEQKAQGGNILEQLIPTTELPNGTPNVSEPLQELAALLLFQPQFVQSMVTSSPSPLQPTAAMDTLLTSGPQGNPTSLLPQQTVVQPELLLETNGKLASSPQAASAEPFILPKAMQSKEALTQNLGIDVEVELSPHAESQASKPLFGSVEHIPVKVGDSSPLNTQSSDFPQQLSKQLSQAALQGEQTLSLRLAPESLGTVTVEMTRTHDGSLQILLKASTTAATNLLSDRAAELSGLLRSSTQSPVYVDVQNADPSQFHQQDQQGNSRQHSQQQHQQPSQNQQQSQDFLEQLRLGLVSFQPEAS